MFIVCVLLTYSVYQRKGYAFSSLSVGQVKESDFPADKPLIVGNKLVGLQFSRQSDQRRMFYTPFQEDDYKYSFDCMTVHLCLFQYVINNRRRANAKTNLHDVQSPEALSSVNGIAAQMVV